MTDEDAAELRRHANDCDRRLVALETSFKVLDGGHSSLRASRHEHGEWLNRHNLEINELQRLCASFVSREKFDGLLKFVEGIDGRMHALETWKADHMQFVAGVDARLSSGLAEIKKTVEDRMAFEKSRWDKIWNVLQPLIQVGILALLVSGAKIH